MVVLVFSFGDEPVAPSQMSRFQTPHRLLLGKPFFETVLHLVVLLRHECLLSPPHVAVLRRGRIREVTVRMCKHKQIVWIKRGTGHNYVYMWLEPSLLSELPGERFPPAVWGYCPCTVLYVATCSHPLPFPAYGKLHIVSVQDEIIS